MRLHPAIALCLCLLAAPAGAQSCRWDGTAPFCDGSCSGSEVELTRLDGLPPFWNPPFVNTPPFGAGCWTGSKALCCSGGNGNVCRWEGTAPFCDGECEGGWAPGTPPAGSSSGASCWTGSKVYCCTNARTIGQPLVAQDCRYGPDTCAAGYVWREARRGDHVCVLPATREQVRADNARAAVRQLPGGRGGRCPQGLVWREAYPGDHVCVSPPVREQTRQDNGWAAARDACPE